MPDLIPFVPLETTEAPRPRISDAENREPMSDLDTSEIKLRPVSEIPAAIKEAEAEALKRRSP